MKFKLLPGLIFAGGLLAAVFTVQAQTVLLKAAINAGQETPTSGSPATGTAVMSYNVTTNSYTLTVTLNNFPNALVSSGIAEAAAGASGTVVNNLGSEAASYTRSGNTLTASWGAATYVGTPVKLLQKGAYLNFTSAAFPGGEIRGQLIAQPVRLYANITSAAEIPATRASGVSLASGAAYLLYDPSTNALTTRLNLYNFTNTLVASHYHEGPPGVSGPVVLPLGNLTAYVQRGFSFSQVFNQTYGGNPITLLSNGSYINVHSTVYPAGEIRGQVMVSTESLNTRMVNGSTLGTVGSGAPLTNGFIISGQEAVLTLITARGPSLTQFGFPGALASPQISVYGAGGILLASNAGAAGAFDAATITSLVNYPLAAGDSALLMVLPPGAYTMQATSPTGATGTALVELFDSR